MRVRFARVVALAMLVMLAAGCTRVLDKQGLEAQLAADLQASGPALTVRCPDGVKAQVGATFQCTATDPDGSSFTITVTQTDDQGNVTWALTSASASPPVSSTTPSTPSPSSTT
jgi:hypothetical protein